ncbi:MAG TPA: hypothetical protein VEF04_23480, partial [Blastocatellia bacterium]|nr:hypothetical protein [Blastocatellia bacterium]
MTKNQVGLVKYSLLALLSFTLSSPIWAQGRISNAGGPDIPVEVQQRNLEIQKIIDRSDERFQVGELQFNSGNYAQARREYDKAVDIVLEAGFDIRTDGRLKQHYQKLIEQVYQRQIALLKQQAPNVQNTTTALQIAQNGQAQPTPDQRGFGQQVYTASPLDELANIQLTEAEKQNATDADAENTVAAARLDFGFKPNALIQSYI